LAIRHQIAEAERTIAGSTRRIALIEQDIAVRTPTRGDLFTMEVGGKTRTERKGAGGSLLSRIRLLERNREKGAWTLAAIGGFEVKGSGEPYGQDHYRLDVWLDRHGYEQEVQLDDTLTALGLIARLEYQLDRFEADLAEHRRRVAEAGQRLPGYARRLGEAFDLQEELDAKAAELAALEADLAANDKVAANDDAASEAAAA
ncbi:MAG: lactate dehydrogenase, partial [Pseudomonadota bacterium]|nr:lactate dehydrogenase [Pseudomonadota bacterium]